MAQVRKRPQERFAARVNEALVAGLAAVGIDIDEIEIQTEPVPGTALLRVLVKAAAFARLQPSERQSLVWRIIEQRFTPEEHLRVSMILALAPEEAA